MHRKAIGPLVAGLTGTMLLLSSACSAPAENGTDDSTSTGSSAIAKEMTQLIEANSQEPAFKEPGPALDASKVAGKTIAIVAIDLRVPALADVVEYAKQAAELLDLNVTVYDAKSQATGMQQGMQQAIDSGADAIISDGLVISIIEKQIKAAKDKGIPTIDVINTPPTRDVAGQGSDPNVFGNMSPDSELAGQLIAATAIAHTDGKAKVALMNTSELTASPTLFASIKETMEKCDGCEVVTETDTALNDWSTQLPGLAATQVRSNPDVNFLLPMYDAMGIFATTGVQQAAATGKVRIASQDGTPAALSLVKDGDIFVADVARSTSWAAWGAVDQAMRGMLGMEPADPVLPMRYVDTDALEDVDTSTSDTIDAALFGTAYKDGYQKLWGLS
jgi:ribose transport system substrate-binding protein